MTSTAKAPFVKHIATKNLPVSIRPRERLASIGTSALSDAELIAVVLGTGARGTTSLQMAQRLLSRFEMIGKLGAADFSDLANIEGIGPAKAAQILAAVELGKRAASEKSTPRMPLNSPQAAADMLLPKMRYLETEHFQALILNNKNQLIKSVGVSVGALSAAVIHPRELFKTAIRCNAAGVIVAHNHPSGDVVPSREDIILTRRLVEAGRILGIDLIDHLIIGDGRWLSFKEKGYI